MTDLQGLKFYGYDDIDPTDETYREMGVSPSKDRTRRISAPAKLEYGCERHYTEEWNKKGSLLSQADAIELYAETGLDNEVNIMYLTLSVLALLYGLLWSIHTMCQL